jgi:Protein of unknown function (DUF420)
MFLPALNALLNGSCAIALCVGLYFIKHHNREAHRTSMLLAPIRQECQSEIAQRAVFRYVKDGPTRE